jgi:hypothetical protein
MTSWTVDNPATVDFDEVTDLEVRVSHTGARTAGCEEPMRINLGSLPGRVRSEFAGARYGNVGGMSGNVSVTSVSGAITLLRREPVGGETR